MLIRRLSLIAALAATSVAASLTPALGQVPPGTTDAPVLSDATPRGTVIPTDLADVAPTPKSIDGDIADWQGTSSMYGGTALYSAGEYVYQDHIFDSYGPDDGRDAKRLQDTAPLGAVPGAYRIEALAQADAPGQLGVDVPEQYQSDDTYGDATDEPWHTDILEARIAEQNGDVALLVRTTTMHDANQTGVLVLADTDGLSGAAREVPFNAGITTEAADFAFFLSGSGGSMVELATGNQTDLAVGSVATDPSGYNNAIEALLPGDVLGASDGSVAIALATGVSNGTGFTDLELETNSEGVSANLSNVAFRSAEPVRIWFDQAQALALFAGSIDDFFSSVSVDDLRSGKTQELEIGPGYHDRLFLSSPNVTNEGGRDGLFQHYGLFLPEAYSEENEEERFALQWWLHWRGGSAHSGGAVVPRVFQHFGENHVSIVVAPSGRGSSTWYVGKGHVDIQDVWKNVFETLTNIDENRVYVTGHSMGGWGSYLLTLLYPDRFAAAAPVAGPVTQGAWTGADFAGCDGMQSGEYTPCYISANGSNPRAQHTRKLLENARHVPYAILHGVQDELVPVSGVTRQVERLIELNYRHRYFIYPVHEHYSHPVMDQWTEAAAYMQQFTRPENPARVTYKRDMPFERATETVQAGGFTLNFDFDSAYWMSHLEPTDLVNGTASFDGTSLAISAPPYQVLPDDGGPTAPGTTGPYFYEGLQWLQIPSPIGTTPATSNGFTATLTGASKVQLHLERMAITTDSPISGSVTTNGALTLRLAGFDSLPPVAIDGVPVAASLDGDVLVIQLPAAGTFGLTIG